MTFKSSWVFLILALFLFRLLFGLFNAKWQEYDQKQTYLIGLKQYTTQTWPYFGPDLTGAESSYSSQIPGALEGLLIGLSFKLLPIPEAPYITLNILSMAGVVLLAWYIARRSRELSFGWLLVWIGSSPWCLNYSTSILNPCYLLLSACLFFVGLLETLPMTRLGLVPISLANVLMGFAVGWAMQFHASYIYFVPLLMISLFYQFGERRFGSLLWVLVGMLPMAALIIPTYLQYGLSKGGAAAGFASGLNWDNVKNGFVIFARYLSIPCFEMPRFIEINTKARVGFLLDHWWLLAPGAILWILGLLQPFVLLIEFFRKRLTNKSWRPLKLLVLFGFVMVYISFWFTVKKPLAHIYYILFPLLMIYSSECYVRYAQNKLLGILTKVVLVLCVYFQLGYALAVKDTNSLYPERDKVVQAIQQKDYRILGDRYPGSLY